ncbi:MAG: GNAT family N-acetyltransferase [Candidatus Riflebacteria bacterium]|nr:GNAT family N-acetyltransferase [Candidatus Riflebacteria bacterium]
MTINDYEKIIELFRTNRGITVRDADSKESVERYLQRNSGLNFVAEENQKTIGCVMCGHDGKRGYLQHMIVLDEFRNRGIGTLLFQKCIDSLKKIGIYKTHLFVNKTNDLGNQFWKRKGWMLREDIFTYSFNSSTSENA